MVWLSTVLADEASLRSTLAESAQYALRCLINLPELSLITNTLRDTAIN